MFVVSPPPPLTEIVNTFDHRFSNTAASLLTDNLLHGVDIGLDHYHGGPVHHQLRATRDGGLLGELRNTSKQSKKT